MAEKPIPVSVEARRLDISILPHGFSIPLTDYLVNQSDDVQSIANQANGAAEGAYQAQLTNEEQDVLLAEHTDTLLDHGNRIDAAELTIQGHEQRISTAEATLQDHETRISDIEGDYVSKSETSPQSLASPLNVAASYSIGGVKVVGPRQVGWTAAGGSVVANIGAWNPNTLAPASATYSQAESTAVRQQLNAAEARLKAMELAMRNHGLIS
ncbi:MAG: hypothetical protein ACRDC6_26350 [Shewanella sp.]